jgi:hypothetical protein
VTDAGAHGFTTNDEDGDGFLLKEPGNPRAARICTIIMQRTKGKKGGRREKKKKGKNPAFDRG